jgi:rhombotail lipoprotein
MTARRSLFIIGTLLSIALTGCSSFWSSPYRQGSSSSLVEYLYPQGARPEGLAEEIPQITVPARIGLAFVPGTGGSQITQAQKIEVLDEVRSHFAEHRAIDQIQIIPDSYLRINGVSN